MFDNLREEVTAGAELHDEVVSRGVFEVVHQLHDVGVRPHRAQDLNLLLHRRAATLHQLLLVDDLARVNRARDDVATFLHHGEVTLP